MSLINILFPTILIDKFYNILYLKNKNENINLCKILIFEQISNLFF